MCLEFWFSCSWFKINPMIPSPEDIFQVDEELHTGSRTFSSCVLVSGAAHFMIFCTAKERNVRYCGAKMPSECRNLYKITRSVHPSISCDRRVSVYVEQAKTFPESDSNGLLYYSHWRAIKGVNWFIGSNAPDTINSALLKHTVTEVVKYHSLGRYLDSPSDIHALQGGALTGLRYVRTKTLLE